MKLLSVASEMFPLVKTGGLADVVGALPAALAPLDIESRTLLPGYPAVTTALHSTDVLAQWPDWFGGPARLLASRHGGLEVIVLDAPHLYDRAGNPYVDGAGRDWPDNAERFAALAAAAAWIGSGAIDAFVPDAIHAHDWQAALTPAYLRFVYGIDGRRPATVLTLHNLAFQGRFDRSVRDRLRLPDEAYRADALEYYGDIGFLKAGILMADAVTTVSPTYAREILTADGGMGMDAMLRWRGAAVSGIVNGIDTVLWDPATDPSLPRTYETSSIDARADNKRALEGRFGLAADDGPLLCLISRLTTQKGIDLFVDALDAIVATGARLIVLGAGDADLERALLAGAARHPGRVAVLVGYDEGLSHLLQGGSDAILIPSRFEPCGLTQLYGLRYGCVPVVSRVGGLADTVIDANDAAIHAGVATGIVFPDVDVAGLLAAVTSAVGLYRRPEVWRAMQRAGMHADVGWRRSAMAYAALYRRLIGTSG